MSSPLRESPSRPDADAAYRLVVAYKFVRGGIAFVFGLVLAVMAAKDGAETILAMAAWVHRHATSAWSKALAEPLAVILTPGHLYVAALALVLDGTMTLLEGYALHTRRRWGAWLVVVTTSALVPFEVSSLVRHLGVGRAALLVVNVLVAFFLARRATRRGSP